MNVPHSIRIIDSHTAGEPTRVVVDGAPTLLGQSLTEKRDFLRSQHDWLRRACLNEPRGHEAMVGAMLCESTRADCVTGVVFFNNVGYLGGCIHGTIGVAQTLVHLGRVSTGEHGIETPVGRVVATVHSDGSISVRNVHSFRYQAGVEINLPSFGPIRGDIAWGGNWFFLVDVETRVQISIENTEELTRLSGRIRLALQENEITGANGDEIDHIELFGPPADPMMADSKNFVLCPGHVYDRSPCGTGTSAKLACLFANEKLRSGQIWRQAGILNSVFEGFIEPSHDGGVIPTVRGQAFVNGETKMIIAPNDPFRFGIPLNHPFPSHQDDE